MSAMVVSAYPFSATATAIPSSRRLRCWWAPSLASSVTKSEGIEAMVLDSTRHRCDDGTEAYQLLEVPTNHPPACHDRSRRPPPPRRHGTAHRAPLVRGRCVPQRALQCPVDELSRRRA